jgi:hypothetical protein
MSPSIPQELVDQIIDHLHDDTEALNVCALTARDWLPSTRYHLFRSIRFNSPKKIKSFQQLSWEAPDVLPYCQEAILCNYPGYTKASLLEAVATACLTLPNLERIEIRRTLAFTPRVLSIRSPVFNGITTLTLSGAFFLSPNNFWPLICSFPNLNTVQAFGVNFNSTEETSPVPINTYEPPITTFSISASRRDFVIDHLTNSPFPLHFLRNLEIQSLESDQTTLVPLAKSIQGTVTQLRFFATSILRADDQSGSLISSILTSAYPAHLERQEC